MNSAYFMHVWPSSLTSGSPTSSSEAMSYVKCTIPLKCARWLRCLSKIYHFWLNIGLMLYFELYAPDVSKKYLQILFFFIQILFFVKTKMKIILQGQIQTYHQNSIEPNMVHFTQVLNSVTRLYIWLFGLKKY